MKKESFLFPVLLSLAIAGVTASAVMIYLLTIALEEDLTARIKTLMFGVAIAFLAFLLSLTYLLLRNRILKPLSALAEYAQRLIGGNGGPASPTTGWSLGKWSDGFRKILEFTGKEKRKLEKSAEFADSNPNLIMTMDRDGRIVYVNRRVERTLLELGLPSQHHELLLPDGAEDIVDDVLSGKKRNREVTWEVMGRTIVYTAFALERNELVGFYGVDVTEKPCDPEARKATCGREKEALQNLAHSEHLASAAQRIGEGTAGKP